jgi:hypothetical protein
VSRHNIKTNIRFIACGLTISIKDRSNYFLLIESFGSAIGATVSVTILSVTSGVICSVVISSVGVSIPFLQLAKKIPNARATTKTIFFK